jgi:phytanoyl-CoA hydroxylase
MHSIRSNLARDGFAVVPGLFSASELAAIKQRAKSLIANRPSREASIFSTRQQQRAPTKDEYFMTSGGAVRFFMEDSDPEAVNKIGHALHDQDDVFGPFCYSSKVRAVCNEIEGLETDPRIVQTMYICKGPKTGGEVSAHQDNAFLMTSPLSVHGLWVAVDRATQANGCLWAVPGSHRSAPSHFFRALPSREGAAWDEGYDANAWAQEAAARGVPIEADAGTLVILHGNLVHYSAPNTSNFPREAFTMHVVDGRLPWSRDNWLQRDDGFRAFLTNRQTKN